MTRNEFEELQLDLQQSGMKLKSYLKHIGTNYSTYNYWRKKFQVEEDRHHELARMLTNSSFACGNLLIYNYQELEN